jgi:hypothetical protein
MDHEQRPLSVGAFKTFVAEYKAAKEADDTYQKKTLGWSVKTFIAVSIYTAITAALLLLGYCTLENGKTDTYYSQRASVILRTLLPIPVTQNNTLIGYLVIPQWENVGNTYAAEMTFHSNYFFSRDDLPNGFTVVDGPGKIEGPTSLGSKEFLTTGAFRDINSNPVYFPQSCLSDAVQGRFRFMHLWGWAKYKDILRPNEERTTRFCWRLYGTLTIKAEIQFNHYLCEEGNCQDGACDKYKAMHAPRLPQIEACQPIQIPTGANLAQPPVPSEPVSPTTK